MDITLEHPTNTSSLDVKHRLTFEAGEAFIEKYLQQFSHREDYAEFLIRQQMTYCPAFAKAAINEVKNAIFNRMIDIRRIGGPLSYQQAVNSNVDLAYNSMTAFIGGTILPELLALGSVGVFVDMPREVGITKLESQSIRPYLYHYQREDIRSWRIENQEFTALFLRDHVEVLESGLPVKYEERYRLLEKTPDGINVTFYDSEGELIESLLLDIPRIPFVLLELPYSLLADVANYQIALLNIESSDINFILKGNFPFYIEQYEPYSDPVHFKTGENFDSPGEAAGGNKEIKVGISQGRRYAAKLNPPQFIHPSPEPLVASLKKGEQIRQDIRLLVNLAVENLTDSQGLRDGLAYIALILERCERSIGELWAIYEGDEAPVISYPENYTLQTDKDRITKAQGLDELKNKIVSPTYQREISKCVVDTLLGGRLSQETVQKIHAEIDAAPTLTSDPKTIHLDLEHGLVSDKTASLARGYAEGEEEQAKKDRAERVKLTLLAQTAPGGQAGGQARGVDDFQTTQRSSQEEKRGKRVRGEDRYER